MAAGTTDHPLERLIFFSDAVFAIAITLLVIEIHPPHLAQDGIRPTLDALGQLIPRFAGFAVSFTVIGAFWAGHHRAFGLADRLNRSIIPWNLALLGTIAFMPFVTGFMSGNYSNNGPAAVYWGWLVLTALLNLKVNSIATSPAMRAPDASQVLAREVPRRSRSVILAALSALTVSQFAPEFAPFAMASIPLWLWLIRRLAGRPAPVTAEAEVDA